MAILLGAVGASSRADVFHLTTGATIEGDLVDEAGGKTRIMLTSGSVVLSTTDIASREASPTILQRYAAEKAKQPDTAQGEYDLGAWCDRNGLAVEARAHYRAAIAKDPEFAAAYRTLGYVAVGDAWLDGSVSCVNTAPAAVADKSQQPLLQEITTEWSRRIHAIRYADLDPPMRRPSGLDEQGFAQGRRQLLAIKDPLAIPAMARALSAGTYRTRRLLVELLGTFPQDEATLNLLALALLDPDPLVRTAAATELGRRKDPRVETELRKALKADGEDLLRRAATALGVLKARSAVADLIAELTPRAARPAAKTEQAFFADLTRTFNKPTTVELGGRAYRHVPAIDICQTPAAPPAEPTHAARTTRAEGRAEVREALKAITGEDFGFDAEAWKGWEKEHPATRPAGVRP